jgi:hypothetical protein
MIRALCHTADNALALEFDATPWFREADPQSILMKPFPPLHGTRATI